MGEQAPISSCTLAEQDVLACNFTEHSGQQIHFFPRCICTSRKLGSSQLNEGLKMRVKGSLSPSATRAFLGTGHFSVSSQLHSYLLGQVLASVLFFPVPSMLGYCGGVCGDFCHCPRLAELSLQTVAPSLATLHLLQKILLELDTIPHLTGEEISTS